MKPPVQQNPIPDPDSDPHSHLPMLPPENPPPSYSEAVELAEVEDQNQQNDGKEQSRNSQGLIRNAKNWTYTSVC